MIRFRYSYPFATDAGMSVTSLPVSSRQSHVWPPTIACKYTYQIRLSVTALTFDWHSLYHIILLVLRMQLL